MEATGKAISERQRRREAQDNSWSSTTASTRPADSTPPETKEKPPNEEDCHHCRTSGDSLALAAVPALAQNETTTAGPVIADRYVFNPGKDREDTASLTLSPPPTDISCPPGEGLELASVTYTNVVLTPASRPQRTGLASACSLSTRNLRRAWWFLFTRMRRSEALRTSHVKLFPKFAELRSYATGIIM